MTTSALTARIGGQTFPLASCFWVLADATGCAYGSMHGDLAATAEQAHVRLTRLQRDRTRQQREGWTVALLSPEQWGQQAKACFLGTCAHRAAGAEAEVPCDGCDGRPGCPCAAGLSTTHPDHCTCLKPEG